MEHFVYRSRDQVLVGSTDDDADIYDRWLKYVANHLYKYKLSAGDPPDTKFKIHARSRTTDDFTIARFVTLGGKSRLIRSAREIGDDDSDRYALYVNLLGDLEFSQFGRNRRFAPIHLTLISASEPATHTKLGDNDTLCFLMPSTFVDRRIVSGENLCLRSVAAKNGLANVAYHTLMAFEEDASKMNSMQFRNASAIVGDLVLLALTGSVDLMSSDRSARAGNLVRAKRFIQARFHESDLALSDIADQCGISLNYLHKLFRDDVCTASEYLKECRLQSARQMLESPIKEGTSITEVALSCGYTNMSQFSTTFRHAFGVCPRDVLHRNK